MNSSSIQLLKRLWGHISIRRRGQFLLLLILMVFTSFSEVLSIGAVLPFLAILTDPVHVFVHPNSKPIINTLGLTEPKQLLLPLTIAFGLAAIAAGLMRLILLWASSRLSFATGADLSMNIYKRTLYQSYAVHVARNSSEVINGISTKANGVIYNIILPTLTLISSAVILVAILVAILSVDPIIALAGFLGFGLIYATVILATRRRLILNSRVVASESTRVIKSLQEGLGGIRDVLIEGSQDKYCQIYSDADQSLRRAQGSNLFVSASPRHGMEALGMILISVMAYTLAKQEDGIAKAVPILGAIALGAQRMLPVLQQAYSSWAMIQGGEESLKDTLNLLDQPLPVFADKIAREPMLFLRDIELKQIAFRYSPQSQWVLKGLDLKIYKGSKIGFIGETGSGKSTLLDVIMGLLEPSAGHLAVDGQVVNSINQRTWQSHIAHVPQAIFLTDSTIAENIAYGVPAIQIDLNRVRKAARQAQIDQNIESWPNRYKTIVGERGIRLSGGERQRIGIARALYKQTDIIILDEATIALDTETEQSVMCAIDELSEELTILIIAHRLTTLKSCSQIVELSGGRIKRVGTYQEMVTTMININ